MKRKIKFSKILIISLISAVILQLVYLSFLETNKVTAASVTDDIVVTLTVDSGISITSPSDVTMAPNMGILANSSIGSAVWNVKTNHASGYSLGVKASASPALVSGGNSFADYTEAVNGTPESWSVPSGSKEFGYSAYGSDTPDGTWGAVDTCGTAGTPGANLYAGFEITDKIIATRNTVTTPSGIDTTICFAAEQDGIYAASGVYTATITATATEI